MNEDCIGTITTLLHQMQDGSEGASNSLMLLVYEELKSIAKRSMTSVPASDTLQPTALVNEAAIRLLGKTDIDWESRRHFFGIAALAMHDIIVQQARRHSSKKHGGNRKRISLEHTEIAIEAQAEELIDLSESLIKLKEIDSLAAEVVMLRFFSGLTHEQTALALGIPKIKVRREWQYAKAFLQLELETEHSRFKRNQDIR